MIWVLVAVFGCAAWFAAVCFFVALCSAATRLDERSRALTRPRAEFVDAPAYVEAKVIRLSSRDKRRSLSSLPSV